MNDLEKTIISSVDYLTGEDIIELAIETNNQSVIEAYAEAIKSKGIKYVYLFAREVEPLETLIDTIIDSGDLDYIVRLFEIVPEDFKYKFDDIVIEAYSTKYSVDEYINYISSVLEHDPEGIYFAIIHSKVILSESPKVYIIKDQNQ